MGAWSIESFGNDTACDWAYGLEQTSDLGLVRETIQKVLDTRDEYLEEYKASHAIAAIEVIARLKGNFGVRDSYSSPIDVWVAAHPQPPPQDLVKSAILALDRILAKPSELLEIWEDSGLAEAWKSSVFDLRNRVADSSG
jgi:hypothetical protein